MTDVKPAQIVAITNDDGTWYLLPDYPFSTRRYSTEPTWRTADGEPLADARRHNDRRGGWWKSPTAPQALTATRPGESTRTGWRLRDATAESPKFPLEVTNREFIDRGFHDEGDSPAGVLYEGVYAYAPDESVTFPIDGMALVTEADAPPADDGLVWSVNIHDELHRHPELFHLFPGRLTGFRAAFIEECKALPFMRVGFFGDSVREDSDRRGTVELRKQVPYEPRNTRFVHDTDGRGKRLKRGKTVVETKDLRLALPVADAIPGANRAEAKRAWDERMAELLELVTAELTPAPCWHCKGTGVVSHADAAKVGGESA